MILTELCQELKNWFCNVETDIHEGTFTIKDGTLSLSFLQDGQYFRIVGSDIHGGTFTIKDGTLSLSFLQDGQYFRIVGSVFNDGVHKYGEAGLQDETFKGTVWEMRVPPSVISLASDIDAWIEKNGEVVASPYQSESWAGYSYSLKSGGGESGAMDWRTIFAGSLNRWRKLCP